MQLSAKLLKCMVLLRIDWFYMYNLEYDAGQSPHDYVKAVINLLEAFRLKSQTRLTEVQQHQETMVDEKNVEGSSGNKKEWRQYFLQSL